MPISCPKCGIINPQGAETCSECGWTLDSAPLYSTPKGSQSPPPPQPSTDNKEHISGEENEDLLGMEDQGTEGSDFLKGRSTGVSGASILSGKEKKTAPIQVQILSGILWVMSAAMIAMSIFILKPNKSVVLPIPFLSDNLPFRFRAIYALLVLAAGIYTLITAYGVSNLKRWGVKVYISWVMVQVVLEILARIYHQQLGAIFSAVVLVELVFILLLWQIKHRFLY